MTRLRPFLTPLLAAAIAFLVTIAAWFFTKESLDRFDQARFHSLSAQVDHEIAYRMQTYINTLVQTKSLFQVSKNVSRQDFKNYVESLNVLDQYPGIQGVGYTVRIPRSKLNEHTQKVRSQGFPNYRVWPQDDRSEYFSVIYLEPFDWRNQRAFGYDMFTDPIRHEAMARARDSGMPAATAKVTLVQETQQGTQVGFLIYVPVYARGAPTRTVEERRRALVGFIYSPFRAQDLFEGIFAHKTADNPIDFEVFTEARAERQALLYERVQGDYPPSSVWDRTNLVQPYSLNVGGQKWTVVTRPLPLFYDKSSRVVPRAIALFGLLGSILLFWIVRRHGRYIEAERERAFQMETLNRIGKVLSAELDLKKLVQAVTDAGKELSKAQFGTFYYHVTDQKGESSTLYSLSGLSREQLGRQHVQSMLEVPVVSRTGEEIGRLIYSHMRPNVFGEREKKLVEGLAAQSAIAVDNARLFQRSKDAISLRDEFLSIASHELKTPITSLKLHLQMTRRAVKPEQGITPPAEKLARVLDTSTTQVNRLSALIDDLLDVSRIQAGKLTYHFEKTELAGLVREMVDRFCEQLQAAGCETSIQTDEPVYVRCDRFRLEQVILNLLSNATKYGAGRPIEVIVENQSGMARVVVRDRGMGIPSEKLEMVFERFERAVSPSNISGLGLGLYISREIVNAHHGHIHVESQLGQGSSFIVDLPIAADQSSTQPSSMGQAG